MSTISFTTTIQAPKAAVFGYLSDPNNLPEWATEFCQELIATADGYRVITPMGPIGFRIATEPNTGVIDMLTRMEDEPEGILATRVLSQSDKHCAWVVTFTPCAGLPEAVFLEHCSSLERDMANVQRLFA